MSGSVRRKKTRRDSDTADIIGRCSLLDKNYRATTAILTALSAENAIEPVATPPDADTPCAIGGEPGLRPAIQWY